MYIFEYSTSVAHWTSALLATGWCRVIADVPCTDPLAHVDCAQNGGDMCSPSIGRPASEADRGKGTICSIPCIEDASVCFPIYPAILSGMFYGSLCPEVEAALQAEARLTLFIKIVGAHSVLSSNYFDPDGRLRTAC